MNFKLGNDFKLAQIRIQSRILLVSFLFATLMFDVVIPIAIRILANCLVLLNLFLLIYYSYISFLETYQLSIFVLTEVRSSCCDKLCVGCKQSFLVEIVNIVRLSNEFKWGFKCIRQFAGSCRRMAQCTRFVCLWCYLFTFSNKTQIYFL